MSTHLKPTLSAAVAALAGLPALCIAQSPPGNATATGREKNTEITAHIEEVVVTGSLLKRALGDVAQPITVIQAEDLVRSGATNPEQIMQQIGQNQANSVSTTSIGRRTAGSSYANLRSLGSERTLVLVNGKRIVNSLWYRADYRSRRSSSRASGAGPGARRHSSAR